MNRAKTSLFRLMIGTGMFVVWDIFFRLSLFISSKICANETKLKLNFGLFVFKILSIRQTVLGWSLYFSMEPFTLFTYKFEVCSLKYESFGIDRFLIISQKQLLKVSAIKLPFWRTVPFSNKIKHFFMLKFAREKLFWYLPIFLFSHIRLIYAASFSENKNFKNNFLLDHVAQNPLKRRKIKFF